ncbi:MAG: mannitol dehydrogenase-like protein [Blastococcus sp.]|nr:mannitol dehydrogenase-like protein [Blastococcus sp.]
MKNLSDALLPSLPDAVDVPRYDRGRLRSGIVHVGLGHFHRAHQAVYLDDLMRQGQALDWAIAGAGIRPGRVATRDALAPQDYLYTLTAKDADGGHTSRVIGSVCDIVLGPDDPNRLVEKIADPTTRILSLTITEGGYGVDAATGDFAPADPAIEDDLRAEVPNGTVFGVVLQAMQRRRERGVGGLTIMSCDNVQENGVVARAAFLGFAEHRDPATARWMEQELRFPNSMVDRVTPGTVDADRQFIHEAYGYQDRWPVTCEPFRQWVLEDSFACGRPPLEDAGVLMVGDVEPYELMKLRLANGTHQALCYFGHLLGYEYVHEAITDPDIRAMLLRYIDEEAVPTLTPIAGVDAHAYGRTVIERFSNPQLRDPLSRICADTSDRIPTFLLPVVTSQLASGGRVEVCAAVVASWARYAEGVDEHGAPIDVKDPRRDALMAAARRYAVSPTAFLEERAVFGTLAQSQEFVTQYTSALDRLHADGARAVVRSLSRTGAGR